MQMLTAKRFVSLGLRHVDDLMPGDAETVLGGRVAAYRSARGFAASPPAAHACHGHAAWCRMPDSQVRPRDLGCGRGTMKRSERLLSGPMRV